MSRKVILGTTVGAALFFMIVGVIFWGGFNTAMEATNTLDFCISCHEMEENVYQEYKKTIHYTNRSGVRAVCSDCHVPKDWVHKVVRKIKASNEIFHKIMGTVDTPEKFNQHRLELAKRVWNAMKSTDSRECRNCHDFASMNPQNQKGRSRKQHMNAMRAGNTCIDCHKGIAHTKVHDQLSDEELEALEAPNPAYKRPIPKQWLALEAEAAKKPASHAKPKPAPAASAKPAAPAAAPAAASGSGIDWSSVPATEIVLFYPGQASLEWVLNGRDHGGARPLKAGDRCYDCHEGEEADIGDLIVSGEKVEPTPIPGKRGSIPLSVQAAHDSDYLYLRFQWPAGEHTPAPFVEGGKMDPENPIKLAVMLATDDEKVEFADRAGCWQTCHADLRTMPDTPDAATLAASPLAQRLDLGQGVTKYLKESRTALEIKGKGGKPRGGWDKLKEQAEIEAALKDGRFMDLLRFNAGSGVSEDGYILAERVMQGGQGVEFTGQLNDGVWTVEMKRKLVSDQPGDISLATDQWYNIGFAIHDDYTNSRYHHVSLGLKLGFDDEDAEINAIAR
ncbi:NapC/NirT family cytochrome c [Thiohalobacter sp. IOR34]|uniref:NapC/NirT family cytochrome c n=1 Tax=Thiohalobacter sp. IOR34 TaxID=3057176 RepID=UPI0025AFCBA1|nr:NapC/NirT family cytochrome c [Thiohalobacter sp. IOR34]WJW75429.1 NapC/NirT family cytochrome c [Thiohalobacter sp. IOR34]